MFVCRCHFECCDGSETHDHVPTKYTPPSLAPRRPYNRSLKRTNRDEEEGPPLFGTTPRRPRRALYWSRHTDLMTQSSPQPGSLIQLDDPGLAVRQEEELPASGLHLAG